MIDTRKINSKSFFTIISNKNKISFLLQYAILAPSTHNSQPWLFKIKPDSCEIYKDFSKNIPIADKLGRDMYISLGCMIENLIIAAEYYNIKYKIDYHFKNELIATVKFRNLNKSKVVNKKNKDLIDAILKRSTRRGIFKKKSVSKKIISKINGIARKYNKVSLHLINTVEDKFKLAELTSTGMIIAYNNSEFRKEMSGWFVNNLSNRKDGIPGYSINLPTFHSIIFPFLIRFINIGSIIAKLNKKSIRSAPFICIITSKENDFSTWVEVGRLSERVMLELVSKKVYSSITVSAIEMGEIHKDVKKIINTQQIPQFFFSFGYISPPNKFTQRYALKDKIIF